MLISIILLYTEYTLGAAASIEAVESEQSSHSHSPILLGLKSPSMCSDAECPQITLAEMLDDLDIGQVSASY